MRAITDQLSIDFTYVLTPVGYSVTNKFMAQVVIDNYEIMPRHIVTISADETNNLLKDKIKNQKARRPVVQHA